MGGCASRRIPTPPPKRNVHVSRAAELWRCPDATGAPRRYLVERGRCVSSAVRAVVRDAAGGTRVETARTVYLVAHSPPPEREVTWARLLRARLDVVDPASSDDDGRQSRRDV